MPGLVPSPGWATGFSPASLFVGGYVGAWYDPADLSTLFQDSAATTPVAADGDPVGCVRDKSGNGNDWKQATSGLRPVWHTSGGLSWIETDGSDDLLDTTAAFSLATPWTLSLAASYPSGSNNSINGLLTLVVGSTNFMFTGVRQDVQRARTSIQGASASPAVSSTSAGTSSPAFPHTTPAVLTGQITTNLEDVRVNGVQDGSAVTTWNTQTVASAKLRLGRVTGALPFATKCYGAVAIARSLTTGDLLNLERFLGGKCGVTI